MDDMYKINNFNRSKRTIGKTEQIKNTNSKTTHIKNNNKCKYRRTNLEQRDGTSKKTGSDVRRNRRVSFTVTLMANISSEVIISKTR